VFTAPAIASAGFLSFAGGSKLSRTMSASGT